MGNHADANGDSTGTGTLSHQRRSVLFAALGACLLGLFMIHHSVSPPPPPPQTRAVAIASPNAITSPHTAASPNAVASPSTAPVQRPPAHVVPDAHPTRLSIPVIGVNAPFTGLDLGPSGVLNPPPSSDTNLVGWYQAGTVPGNKGTAIVLGHVDTKTAPAVFWSLSALTKGATVDIARDDKVTATFTVDSVEVFPKDQFPDDRVYGNSPDAQLRLITCGGVYDHARSDYTANVVVFAHLTGLRES